MLTKLTFAMVCVLAACAGGPPDVAETTVFQTIGLPPGAVVPPKGAGVAPISGYPGQVPASIPAASVGASGTPGSISPYGGQWVIPLPVSPGAKIANVSCDLQAISSEATTVELVGRGGLTILSKVVGPAGNVWTTAWLLPTDVDPNGYTVGDGEHVAVRLSFRDAVTGAWSSGVQQVPLIGCAVNAISTMPLAVGTVYTTIPSNLFSAPDIHVGVNGQVYQVTLTSGQFTGASVTGQCGSSGFIIACARIRERGVWDWCSLPVACAGAASAVVPLPAPIVLGTSVHVDVALMSGPSVATVPFGVYTTMP